MKHIFQYAGLLLGVIGILCSNTSYSQQSKVNKRKQSRQKPPASATTDQSVRSNVATVGKVIAVQGNVTVKRLGLKKPLPASRNLQLFPGDLFAVADASSSVTIFCLQDFSQKDWHKGQHRIACPPVVQTEGSSNKLATGFIQAPERSKYIKDDMGRMVVRPKGISTQDCLAAIIRSRPGEWGTSISLKDNDALLTSGDKDSLEKQITSMRSRSDRASHDATKLLQADLCALYQNYNGAREYLTDIMGWDNDPYIQLMLGDLFLAGGLSGDGMTSYKQALAAAVKRHDILAQATAHHALSFYNSLIENQPIDQNAELNDAVRLYHEIGYDQTASQLRAVLTQAMPPSLQTSGMSSAGADDARPRLVLQAGFPDNAEIRHAFYVTVQRHDGRMPRLADLYLLTVANNTVILRDPKTGDRLRTITNPSSIVSVDVSTDGRTLLISDVSHKVRVCELATGKAPRVLVEGTESVALSRDGRRVLVRVTADHSIAYVYDVKSGRLLSKLEVPGHRAIREAYFSPIRDVVALLLDKSICIYDLQQRKQRYELQAGNNNYIFFSYGGKRLFLVDYGKVGSDEYRGNVTIVDVDSGRSIGHLSTNSAIASAWLSCSNDLLLLSPGLAGGPAELWDINRMRKIREFGQEYLRDWDFNRHIDGSKISSAMLTPSGEVLLAFTNGLAKAWNASTGEEIGTICPESKGFFLGGKLFDASADGSRVIVGTGTLAKSVSIRDVRTGQIIRWISHSDDTNPVRRLTVFPDEHLALTQTDYHTFLWDLLSTGGIVDLPHYDGSLRWAEIPAPPVTLDQSFGAVLEGYASTTLNTPKEHPIVVAPATKFIVDARCAVIDCRKNSTLSGIGGQTAASAIAFDALGNDAVIADMADKVTVYKLPDGIPTSAFQRAGSAIKHVYTVAISIKAGLVATAGEENTIELWTTAGSKFCDLEIKPKPYLSGVTSLKFSADGRRLLIGTAEEIVLELDTSSKVPLPGVSLRQAVGRRSQAGDWISGLEFLGPDYGWVALDANGESRIIPSEAAKPFTPRHEIYDNDLGFGGPSEGLLLSRRVNGFAVAKGDKQVITGGSDGTARLWDVSTLKQNGQALMQDCAVTAVAYSPSGKYILTGGEDGEARLWNAKDRSLLCTLLAHDDGTWIVVAPNGDFDTNSLDKLHDVNWIMPDDPFTALSPEVFQRQYFEPRLLPRLLAKAAGNLPAEDAFDEPPSLQSLNRVQPVVTVTSAVSDGAGTVAVTVKVENVRREYQREKEKVMWSGAKDIRLFRDKQLVGAWPDEPDTKQSPFLLDGGALPRNPKLMTFEHTFRHVQLPVQSGNAKPQFTAYAFNTSDVKSETSTPKFPDNPQVPPVHRPRAYLISMGVSAYQNPAWSTLEFAANDSTKVVDVLTPRLQDQFEVVPILLTSDKVMVAQHKPINATKENMQVVLAVLSGKKTAKELSKEQLTLIPHAADLKRAAPEDLVVVFFSGHGDQEENKGYPTNELPRNVSYLFPYDIGKAPAAGPVKVTPPRNRCISSEDLAYWLRDVDAGNVVLIVDACHAAATVGTKFKPGPLGSRGMGQLAYDKAMRVLVATQSDAVALEVNLTDGQRKIQQGLLTYALVDEGLTAGRAGGTKDNSLTLSQWLAYAEKRVPELQTEALNNKITGIPKGLNLRVVSKIPKGQGEPTQKPQLFDFSIRVDPKVNVHL